MPNQLMKELKNKLEKHLEEGVEIKLAIVRLQEGQRWLTVVGIIILTAIVGLYFKK